jgi:ABC-type lipoprotein release transport system permease subunit
LPIASPVAQFAGLEQIHSSPRHQVVEPLFDIKLSDFLFVFPLHHPPGLVLERGECGKGVFLALVIACVGLYGTMAYAVARRTREIGIRMELGARRTLVIWMVLREVCVLVALGLAISVPTAFGASRFVESFLFGTKPNDPSALAAAAAILLSAALLAGYGPARKASQIDPMIALRHE